MTDLYISWDFTKKLIQKKLNNTLFQTWIVPLKAKDFSSENALLTLTTTDLLICQSVQKYKSQIEAAAAEVFDCPNLKAEILMDNSMKKMALHRNEAYIASGKYCFENFIEGESNRLAYSASVAVAKNPGGDNKMNPLFIYGDSGLGKTHLMHAIKNEITATRAEKTVLYVSCEEFVNDLIDGISSKKTSQFRNKYRAVDVLLIDDIQFIIDKEKTQIEVFNTFNELIGSGNQIIFSSDCPPYELKKLPPRLTTRLGSGFVVDVKPPEFETRCAIIERKSKDNGIEFPRDVSKYIAENIKSNIRQLENAVNQVIIYSKFDNRIPDLKIAEIALKSLISRSEDTFVSFNGIKKAVAEYYGISIDDLNSPKRPGKIAKPRQIAMYLCKALMPETTYAAIAESFNRKDHTTVMHAESRIMEGIKKDKKMAADIDALKIKIIL